MRLLALVTDAFGAGGGIAQYNRDLLGALSLQPSVETIDVLTRNGKAHDLPHKVEQQPAKKSKIAYTIAALRQTIRHRPDLIFCGHLYSLPLAHGLARVAKASVWLQLHGIDAWEKPGRIKVAQFDNIELVTCVSRYTRKRFLSWAPIDPRRVKVLPNTVTMPTATNQHTLSANMPMLENKPFLLTVGRLAAAEAYKGHDRVIRCLPALLKQQPELRYLIAGDGDDRLRLERLAEDHHVADKVLFLGKVSNEELDTLYRLADLFVMPSTGEGFGIVFLEAMARGTPALGLDADGSADPLQDGELGVVATESGLCAAIEQALRTPPQTDLPDRVQNTFGQQNFQQHVSRLVGLLGAAQPAIHH